VFLSQSRLHQPNWEPYRHDLARARRLLEQAGCRRGADRIYACGEERLSLRLMTTANVPSRRRAIEILARQLQTMGIDARPEVLPASVFFRLLARGDFDAALFSWILSPDDTSQLKNAYGCQGSTNFSGYCQRLSTRDLDQADRILDHDQRARVLSRVDRQLARDVAMIPLYQFVFSLARSSSLRGFELNPAGSLPLNAEDWWLDD
jgi:peptide/nickel transport system substrate-binding protein